MSENQPSATAGGTIDVDFYNRGNTEAGTPVYWRVFYGGVGNAVNAIEAASLIAAGYTVDITNQPVIPGGYAGGYAGGYGG